MKELDKTKYYDISNLNEEQLSEFIDCLKKDGIDNETIKFINYRDFPINRKYIKAYIVYWDHSKWNLSHSNYTDALTLF